VAFLSDADRELGDLGGVVLGRRAMGPMRRQGGSLRLAEHPLKVVIFGGHLRQVGDQTGAGRSAVACLRQT